MLQNLRQLRIPTYFQRLAYDKSKRKNTITARAKAGESTPPSSLMNTPRNTF